MSAYKVFDGDGDVIVFGSLAQLSEEGKLKYATYEEYLTQKYCSEPIRTPEFDDWEEMRGIPIGYLIQEHDWFCECHECGRLVDNNEYDYSQGEDLHPVYRGELCFCTPECEESYTGIRQSLEEAKASLLDKYPWAKIKSTQIFEGGTFSVVLTHPSLKHPVTWDSREPELISVYEEDHEGWKMLTGQLEVLVRTSILIQ